MITRELLDKWLNEAIAKTETTDQERIDFKRALWAFRDKIWNNVDSGVSWSSIRDASGQINDLMNNLCDTPQDYRNMLRTFADKVSAIVGLDSPTITESGVTLTDEQLTAFVAHIIHDMIPHLPFVTGQKIAETHVHAFRKNPNKYKL